MKKDLIGLLKDLGFANYYFVTADVGRGILDDLPDMIGSNFINVGVAETNMMGVAAGLASSENKVFTYTMAAFAVGRALEHLKLDIAYHQKNVAMIGVGTGFYYGAQGHSHWAVDDIAQMLSIGGVEIFNPGSRSELRYVCERMKAITTPSYLRLGQLQGDLSTDKTKIGIDDCYQVCEGKQRTVIVSGILLQVLLRMQAQWQMEMQIISVPVLRPIDWQKLHSLCHFRKILVLEENISVGGIGERFGKYLLENNCQVEKFRSCCVPEVLPLAAGDESFLRQQIGLDPASLRALIESF